MNCVNSSFYPITKIESGIDTEISNLGLFITTTTLHIFILSIIRFLQTMYSKHASVTELDAHTPAMRMDR